MSFVAKTRTRGSHLDTAPSPSLYQTAASPPALPPVRRDLDSPGEGTDSLLWDFSPTTSLRAFIESSPPRPEDGEHGTVKKATQHASQAERAFGMRVSATSKTLQLWCEELTRWPWSGTFQRVKTRDSFSSALQDNLVSRAATVVPEERGKHWGSITPERVAVYRQRLDQIKRDFDELNVDELKEHILNVHVPQLSKSSMQYGTRKLEKSDSHYKHLDDYTTLVTATVLQILPLVSRLSHLLSSWSARLAVLEEVPEYLRGVEALEASLADAWNTSRVDAPPSKALRPSLTFSRAVFTELRVKLGTQIAAQSYRLDNMLDALEGHPETVPDEWIERFEALELGYGNWAAEVQKRVTDKKWLEAEACSPTNSHSVSAGSAGTPLQRNQEGQCSKDFLTSSPIADPSSPGVPSSQTLLHGPPKATERLLNYSPFTAEHIVTSDATARSKHESVDPIRSSSHGLSSARKTPAQALGIEFVSIASTVGPNGSQQPHVEPTWGPTFLSDPSPNEGHELTNTDYPHRISRKLKPSLSLNEFVHQSPFKGRTGILQDSSREAQRALELLSPPLSILSERSTPGFMGTSEMSTPEVKDATFADYFKAGELISRTSSKNSSLHSTRTSVRTISIDHGNSHSRGPLFFTNSPVSRRESAIVSEAASGNDDADGKNVLRRASSTSISTFDRSELKSVLVGRRGSTQSTVPRGTSNSAPEEASLEASSKELEQRSVVSDNGELGVSPVVHTPPESGSPILIAEESPSYRPMRRHFLQDGRSMVSGEAVHKRQEAYRDPTTSDSSFVKGPDTLGIDQFERQISSVLTSIPVEIKLKRASSPRRVKEKANVGESTPTNVHTPLTRSRGPLVLSPAQKPDTPNITTPSSASSDIKLYYLTQPGKDIPMKLFIRLVGEHGERVMVRVGGGWADLAEYLREYASHHGWHTTGVSKIEITEVPSLAAATTPQTLSRPASRLNHALDVGSRPVSRLNKGPALGPASAVDIVKNSTDNTASPGTRSTAASTIDTSSITPAMTGNIVRQCVADHVESENV